MSEDKEYQHSRRKVALLVGVLCAAVVGMWIAERSGGEEGENVVAEEVEASPVEAQAEVQGVELEREKALRGEVERLRGEVEQLRVKVESLTAGQGGSAVQPQAAEAASNGEASAAVEASPKQQAVAVADSLGGLQLVRFSHDWVDFHATGAFKNTTDKVITSFTGRMEFFDMEGNMLHYEEFSRRLKVEPGMVKSVSLPAYGRSENYAYYQSETAPGYPERKYRVRFVLLSVKTK